MHNSYNFRRSGKILEKYAVYYDAVIVSTCGERVTVAYQDRELAGVRLPPRAAAGAVGVVAWDEAAARWTFRRYKDQTLQRRQELDTAAELGWSNARAPGGFTAPRGLIPGVAGRFVEAATEQVTLDVPAEFFEACRWLRVSVETALRAFIADACCIKDSAAEPRADRYNWTGEQGKNAAEDYLNNVFGDRVNLRSLVVYRIPDEDLDNDDEDECQLIQIPKQRLLSESITN